MSALSYRTYTALFGISTLLLSGISAAQPATGSPQSAPAQTENEAQPAAQQTSTEGEPSGAHVVASAPPASSGPIASAPNAASPEPNHAPQSAPAPDDGPRTLIRADSKLGGYGGLDVGYTRLVGKDAALACVGGALLVDHSFSLGLIGCGNASRISGQNYGNVVHEAGDRLELGYGGLVVGYHFFPRQLYNLSLTAMFGGGGAAIVNYRGTSWSDDDYDEHRHLKTHDALFVAEPRLTGYINLTRWARMGAFAGYRFVGGVNMQNLSAGDLSGPVVGGTVQFGWF